jgi:hypothetical protein
MSTLLSEIRRYLKLTVHDVSCESGLGEARIRQLEKSTDFHSDQLIIVSVYSRFLSVNYALLAAFFIPATRYRFNIDIARKFFYSFLHRYFYFING